MPHSQVKRRPRPRHWVAALLALAAGLLAGQLLLHQFLLWRYPQKYSGLVQQYAAEYDLDPNILYAFIHTESGFDPLAESEAGARGLTQITNETFEWIKLKCAPHEEITFDDLYNPAVSIRFGAYFIAASLDRYGGDLSTAAAAYHNGWGAVDSLLEQEEYSRDGSTLHTFPFSRMNRYVYKINHSYQRYQSLYPQGYYDTVRRS